MSALLRFTDSGSGHGWAGAQQMLWNSELEEFVLQAPPFAMNWSVENITLAEQRSGKIWDELSDWAGEGKFEP